MSLILAGFLALMVGISLAFLLDMRDKGIKTADDLEQSLRLPALATVLRFSDTGRARLGAAGLLRLLQWTGSSDEHNGRYLRQVTDTGRFMDVATAKTGAKQAALRQKSFSATIEAYRTIRTRILLSRPDAPPKTSLFTSAVSGEGKTAIAINTAVAFAGLQESVLLVDGDLRRGRCHQIMNRNGSPGLTEVLSGLIDVEDAIQPTSVKGLFMLASGASSPSPSELLGSRKMSEVLAYLESKYKYVFLDSAPVLPVSDSVLLSTIVDAVVIVAGRQTPRQVVRLGGARLASVGARMIGAVLNSVELEHEPYYAQYMQY
jgi:capsular exopolysaccharide synthesis family protein